MKKPSPFLIKKTLIIQEVKYVSKPNEELLSKLEFSLSEKTHSKYTRVLVFVRKVLDSNIHESKSESEKKKIHSSRWIINDDSLVEAYIMIVKDNNHYIMIVKDNN